MCIRDSALRGVDDEQRHVAAVDGRQRADDRKALQRLVGDGALAPDTGGVDQHVFLHVRRGEPRVAGVARRARDVGDHHALLAKQPVDQRRLAHVRLARHGDLDRACLLYTSYSCHMVLFNIR